MISNRSICRSVLRLVVIWTIGTLACTAEEARGPVLASNVGTDGDFLTLRVTVEGEAYTFMVDTGAPTTTVDVIFIDKLKRTLPDNAVDQAYADITGAEFYTSPPMSVVGSIHGEIVFPKNLPVLVSDLSRFRDPSRHDIRGVLGMDLLRNYALKLDLHRGRLELLDSQTVHAGPNDQTVEMDIQYRRPAVDVSSRQLIFDTLIDTGAILTMSLGKDAHERLLNNGGFSPFLATNAEGKSGRSTTGRVLGVKLGPFAHYGLVANRHHGSLLGLHYWRRYYCTFDFPKNKLYLRPSPYFGLHDDGDHCGIVLEDEPEHGKSKRIRLVIHGSIADELGIRAGDSIVTLEGKPTAHLSKSETHLYLSLRAAEVPIVVRRGDDEFTFTIPAPCLSDPLASVLSK